MTFSTGKSEYTSWDSGQPDNGGGKQDCAINNHSKRPGRWDDATCNGNFQVMCEASGKTCSNVSSWIFYRFEMKYSLFIIKVIIDMN